MTQIPFKELPIPLPDVLLSATGVFSRCRFIGFTEVIEIVHWFDGFYQGQFLVDGLWFTYINHLSVRDFLYPYKLNGEHALIFDTRTQKVYVGEVVSVKKWLRLQPHIESESDAPDSEPIPNSLEIIIAASRQELIAYQTLIHHLNTHLNHNQEAS